MLSYYDRMAHQFRSIFLSRIFRIPNGFSPLIGRISTGIRLPSITRYLEIYLKCITLLQVNRSPWAGRIFWFVEALLAIQAFHWTWLVIGAGREDLESAIHCNQVILFRSAHNPMFKIGFIFGTIATFVINYLLFNRVKPQLIQYLHSIIRKKTTDGLIWQTYKGSHISFMTEKMVKKYMSLYVLILIFWVRNFSNLQLQCLNMFLRANGHQSLWNTVRFAISSATFFALYMSIILNFTYLFLTPAVLLKIYKIRMHQVHLLLHSFRSSALSMRELFKSHTNYVANLIYLDNINQSYGLPITVLFVYCSPNCAISFLCSFDPELLQKHMLVLVSRIAYYHFIMFFFHYYLSKYAKCAHSMTNSLFTLCSRRYKCVSSLKVHRRLEHLVSVIAVRSPSKRYSMSYGNLGVISMKAFALYIALYGKLLMNLYKSQKSLQHP